MGNNVGTFERTISDNDNDNDNNYDWFFRDDSSLIVKEKTIPYKVSYATLNVRSGAGTSFAKIGQLKRDDVLQVLEVKDGWAKIGYNGDTAYVSANYLLEKAQDEPTTTSSYKVAANNLKVRTGLCICHTHIRFFYG